MEFIKTYFIAEKSESLIFMAIGVITIFFSAYALWRWGDPFYKGFAIPVILIGLIQIVVGGTVYLRTDKQIADLKVLYEMKKSVFTSTEKSRMESVMKNFSLYKKIEVAFVVIGLFLIFLVPAKEFWLGIGVGMLLQGAIMLTADIFAERSGTTYLKEVNDL
jgi:hypothetical protein